MKTEFEVLGYSVDVYYKKKYFGCYSIEEKDRELMGYYGRKKEILKETFTYKNKKIKVGETITTECFPICGNLNK